MAKRKYSGSSYSPRTPRPRVKAFSPVSPTVQMLRRKMGFKALGKGLLRGVGRAVPYLGAALAAKDAYDFGKDVYNRFRTPTTVERAGTQNMMRAGRVGTARLAGKVRAKKRNSTKLKFKGKSTNFGLQVSGVHSTEEHRFTSKTNQVDADRYESIQIGHTTLPAKVVLLNVSRAMIKHCCLKIGAEIHNFSDGMVLLNKGYAFRNGDIFRWTYYPSWIDSADATSNFIITIVEGETFESFSRKLAVALTTLANGLGTNHLTSIRWHDFEYFLVKSEMSAAKNWCFTINNYSSADEIKLDTMLTLTGHFNYIIYGREIGESNTPHLQGYVQFKKKLRLAQAKTFIAIKSSCKRIRSRRHNFYMSTST